MQTSSLLPSILLFMICGLGATAPAQGKRGGGGGGGGTLVDPALVFVRSGNLFVSNANGTGATQIRSGVGAAETTWSPDGMRLAIGTGNRIWVMNRDGTGAQAIATSSDMLPWLAWSPVLAPDGRSRIAFTSTSSATASAEVFLVEPDGSNLQQLTFTPDVDEGSVSWSPEAQRLAVCRERQSTWEMAVDVLALAAAAGGGCQVVAEQRIQQDTSGTAWFWWVDWSRTGQRLAFVRWQLNGSRSILIADTSTPGQPQLLLPQATYSQSHPSWSPDDTMLVFHSGTSVYRVLADGSSRTTLTSGEYPSWRR